MLKKISEYLDGKKSFIVAGLIFAFGGIKALQVAGIVPVFPEGLWEFIFALLAASGLYGVRDAIRKAEK